MNWYKIAQKIIEYDKHRLPYVSLGHDQYRNRYRYKDEENQIPNSELPEEYIWVINNGILYKEDGFEAHWNNRNEKFIEKLRTAQWKGRFQNKNEKKILSVVSLMGTSSNYRPIPNVILNILYDEFGKDVDIYRFGQ